MSDKAGMADNNPARWYHRCETPECCHYRRHAVIPRGDCQLCRTTPQSGAPRAGASTYTPRA